MRRRNQAAAARFQLRRVGVGAFAGIVLQFQPAALALGLIAGGETLGLVRRHPERGVVHAERLEQPGAQELAKAQAGQFLDEIAQHVDRDRIIPGRSRREIERDLRQLVDHLLQAAGGLTVGHLGLAVGGVDRAAHHKAVGEARGVGHEVDDLHRPRGWVSS